MDTKAKGILISAREYKENDKLAKIFTFEHGIITAKFIGVKKDKAKLKAAAQSFCMADFVFDIKGQYFTVKSAGIIDSNVDILNNYPRLQAGFIILEIIEKLIPLNKPEPEIYTLFEASITELKDNTPAEVLIRFIIYLCRLLGNPILTDSVNADKKIYLDTFEGTFTSIKSGTNVFAEIDKKIFRTIINVLNYTDTANEESFKKAIILLVRCLAIKFDLKLNSIDLI